MANMKTSNSGKNQQVPQRRYSPQPEGKDGSKIQEHKEADMKSDKQKFVNGNNIAYMHNKRKSADRNFSMPHPQRRPPNQLQSNQPAQAGYSQQNI